MTNTKRLGRYHHLSTNNNNDNSSSSSYFNELASFYKDPEEYENQNERKRKIGLAIGARKGDLVEYFESDNKEGYSLDVQDISIKKYKIALWKTVRDILDITGYDVETVEHELILNNKNMATKQSLHVAWSGYANLQQGGDLI